MADGHVSKEALELIVGKEAFANMAGSKTVPLTWGIGGPRIGTATIDENGLAMGEIENPEYIKKLFGDRSIDLSVYYSDEPQKPINNPEDVKEISIGGD